MAAMMPAGHDRRCCCLVGFVDTIERSCGMFKISHGGLVILTTLCDSECGHHTIEGLAVVGNQK